MSIRKDRPITGSLKDRGGMYTAIINTYNGYGERKQKYHALGIPVKGNKRKAEAALQELIRKYESEDGKLARAKEDSPLFADFLTEWLETIAPNIERTTRESYESMRKARLDSFFRERGLRLCEVEPGHIRQLHESIFKDGCNANTVIYYHAVVRKALQYAVRNELIATNPADKVDRPKLSKYKASFYSQRELSQLFDATADDPIALVIQLAAYYGLRRSEVLGLRWSEIDFERNMISINHKVTEGKVNGKTELFTEDKLKTKSSFRTLPLIPCVRALLLAAKEKQTGYKAMFGHGYCTNYENYICVDQMGQLFRPNYITDHFKTLLKRSGMRVVRFHDLRHSCASLLLAQGISMKKIQDWLGHSTFATTADIYAHLDFGAKQESAAAIASAFEPAPVVEAAPANEVFSAEETQASYFSMTMSM